MEEYGGDWKERPNDYLQWLLDDEIGKTCTGEEIAQRILSAGFAAIFTTSTVSLLGIVSCLLQLTFAVVKTMAQALYRLAASPEFVQPLRDEVEFVIKDEGRTRASLSKLHKIDSFLKESQRMDGLGTRTSYPPRDRFLA